MQGVLFRVFAHLQYVSKTFPVRYIYIYIYAFSRRCIQVTDFLSALAFPGNRTHASYRFTCAVWVVEMQIKLTFITVIQNV